MNTLVQQAKSKAEQAFSSGFYCAESTVSAVLESNGIESPLLVKSATAFCSGMSRTCGTCGAVTGAVMAISALLGRDSQTDSVEVCYETTQAFILEFKKQFGTDNCQQLLGCDLATTAGQEKFKTESLGVKCQEYTVTAAALATKAISKSLAR